MGYHPRPQSTMVATKVLISLCVYGLTAAAPQLGQNLNQEVIVNDVVTALQPSIAEAVANALRGLSTTVTSFNSGSTGGAGFAGGAGGAGFSGSNSGFSSTGFSSNSGSSSSSSSANRFSSNSGSSSGSVTGFTAGGSSSGSAATSGSGSGFAAISGSAAGGSSSSSASKGSTADIVTRPEYDFQFNVNDDVSQTYITQQENRDGDVVTGTYSYVNPDGALVTVNYQAGPEGFAQTVDTQEGFVTISEENKAKINSGASVANNAAGFSSSTGSATGFSSGSASGATAGASKFAAGGSSVSNFAAGGSASKFTAGGSTSSSSGSAAGSAFGSNSSGQKVSTVTTTTSALDQEALIAQILAVLQPQISSAVNTAVRQQQSTVTTTSFKSVGQTAGF